MKPYPGAKAGPGHAVCTIQKAEPAVANAAKAAKPDEDEELYEVSLSSEFEVERYGWFGDRWREVLEHTSDAVQLDRMRSGRTPLLADHNSREVIGVLSNPRIEGRTLRASARFSRNARAQEIKRDIDDRIRTNTSVGYIPKRVKLVEENEEKGDLWRVMLWEPLEVSSVAIPADPTVGFGRSAEEATHFPVVVEYAETREVRDMLRSKKLDQGGGGGGAEPVTEPTAEPTVEQGIAMQHAEILDMCERNGAMSMAREFIQQGLTADQVARKLLEHVKTRGVAVRSNPDPLKDMPTRDRSRYSYAAAISKAAGARDGTAKFDGLEREVHEELERQKPPAYQGHGGVFIPMDLRSREQQWSDGVARRALDSKTLAKGSELVFDTPGELIELLRNRAAVVALGAQTLTGLTGPIGFPKQTVAMAMAWVAENPAADVTDSDPGLGLVTLQPKTLQGSTSYSRQLLAQSSIDVETMVRNEIAAGHALAVDRAAIHGQGAAGQPTGIYIAPDVQTKTMGGAVDYVELVEMIGMVADKNATLGSLGFLTTPLMAAKWLASLMFQAAGSDTIWQGTLEVGGTGRVAGYRAVATNQISKTMSGSAEIGGTEHGIIFGNWSDMIIGLFASLELVVDPYAKKKRGLIEVTSFQMADLILRHGESFTKATGATTA